MGDDTETSPAYIGYRLETFVAVFTPVCIIIVALRFYARRLVVSTYDAGDGLIVAALAGQIVAGGIAIGSVRQGGVGKHAGYLSETDPEALTTFSKYLVAISTWYAATQGLAKLAVCLLYRRIFPQRPMRLVVHITMGVLVCTSLGVALADLFGCTPFSAHWGTTEEQIAHCIDMESLYVWGSFPNIVTDVVLLVLPIPILWKLKASAGMRAGVIITFLFGSTGTITSILRFVAFYDKNPFIDPTWNGVTMIIWTVCEPGVYLIAACLLVLRPVFERLGIPMISSHSTPVRSAGGSGQSAGGRRLGHRRGRRGEGSHIELRTIGGTSYGGRGHSGGRFSQLEDSEERPLKKQDIV